LFSLSYFLSFFHKKVNSGSAKEGSTKQQHQQQDCLPYVFYLLGVDASAVRKEAAIW
jgi:hypothetical protein